ncbi:MAG TPA: alpha/beta hydrolase-fold protein [Phycicoccus sp.]|nr:alpha/beta hydrolase-fold protein [Phycicoccus sp.]
MAAPVLVGDHVRFSFDCHDFGVLSVDLDCDRAIAGPREFDRAGDLWTLDLPLPGVHRMEYRFHLRGAEQDLLVLDPDNPQVVGTVFGERSVLTMPGYEVPWWLTAPAVPGTFHAMHLEGETPDPVPVTIWAPEGVDDAEPLPLLLAHDGPEYDQLASLTQYSGALIAAGVLPPHRVVLAHPVLRDAWYSGSPQYLRTISGEGLARIATAYAVSAPVVVMGASLGGLTALLIGLLGDPSIGGVFSQSGSFFQMQTDSSEHGFRYFMRINQRVRQVLDARHTDHPLRVGMTCGGLEENAENNRQMAGALRRAGHTVTYTQVPDLHNYSAWRDALDPCLTEVLRDLW